MMKPAICAVALVAAFGCQALGQDRRSANVAGPACRAWLAVFDGNGKAPDIFGARDQGYCLGVIETIMYTDPNSCPPQSITVAQTVRVVVQYIEARPARMHEDFKKLSACSYGAIFQLALLIFSKGQVQKC